MNKYQWDLEKIKNAVKESINLSEVLIKLNIPRQGNNSTTLKKILDSNNIDYSHFTGRARTYKTTYVKAEVYLNADNSTYLEPDLTVLCDPAKSEDKGCVGAPDWVVEVVSPSSKRMDYLLKLFKYRTAGVREYWIINPEKRIVSCSTTETR